MDFRLSVYLGASRHLRHLSPTTTPTLVSNDSRYFLESLGLISFVP